MAAARCAAAVKYKKPYYFLALDTARRGDDGGTDEERRRGGGHGRIVARILHSPTLNVFHKYSLVSIFFAILKTSEMIFLSLFDKL